MSLPNMKIHTTLNIRPKNCRPIIQPVSRGATVTLFYNLFDHAIHFEDIAQITFGFRQYETIFQPFQFIDYFKKTEDTVAQFDKVYYYDTKNGGDIDLNSFDGIYNRFVPAPISGGDIIPESEDLFEQTSVIDEDNDLWQVNDHFRYEDDNTDNHIIRYVKLTLTSDETLQFEASDDDYVYYEIALQLNTDSQPGMHKKDTVIIEQQPPFKVIESIYSRLSEAQSPAIVTPTVSESLYCAENLVCRD